jgi:hypothetical protein
MNEKFAFAGLLFIIPASIFDNAFLECKNKAMNFIYPLFSLYAYR